MGVDCCNRFPPTCGERGLPKASSSNSWATASNILCLRWCKHRVGSPCHGGSVGRRPLFFRFSPQNRRRGSSDGLGEGATGQRGKPGLLRCSRPPSSFLALTFVPATAPCAVMLPTGEQLSTRSTLKSRSSSDVGMRELLWAGFASLLLCQAEADDGEEYRDHHGLFTTGTIAQVHQHEAVASTPNICRV